MKNNLFKISEVAKLTNITRQALIFYDKKDILKPEYVAENGYRYYTMKQVNEVQIIKMLNEFNIPLKEIKEYIDSREKEGLINLLDKVKNEMDKKIIQTQNYLQVINQTQGFISETNKIDDISDIIVENRDSFTVICSEELGEDEQDNGLHFIKQYEFEEILKQNDIINFGLDTIIKKEYLVDSYSNKISYFCMKFDSENNHINKRVVEGGLYAIAYHKGSFQTSYIAYERLLKYIRNKGYKINGDAYERNISNFLTEKNNENFLLEISIKISKI